MSDVIEPVRDILRRACGGGWSAASCGPTSTSKRRDLLHGTVIYRILLIRGRSSR